MNDPLNVFRLDGKIAIVTGASSGIGAQTVKLFSSLGAKAVSYTHLTLPTTPYV